MVIYMGGAGWPVWYGLALAQNPHRGSRCPGGGGGVLGTRFFLASSYEVKNNREGRFHMLLWAVEHDSAEKKGHWNKWSSATDRSKRPKRAKNVHQGSGPLPPRPTRCISLKPPKSGNGCYF